jgi:hypothetical protein
MAAPASTFVDAAQNGHEWCRGSVDRRYSVAFEGSGWRMFEARLPLAGATRSLFDPMLHLAQDGRRLACSSPPAPQSPWGKLRSQSNKDPITALAASTSPCRRLPHCKLHVQRGFSHDLWLDTGGCNICVSSCSSACALCHNPRPRHACKASKGDSALPKASDSTLRAKGPSAWEASGTSAASAFKPQPSRNETRVMRIIGLPDEAGTFVMSALTSPCWVQIASRWRMPHTSDSTRQSNAPSVCMP